MRRIFVLLAAIVLTGCMKRHLSPGEVGEFIPGLTADDAKRVQYIFEGNHAGYVLIARIDLTPELFRHVTDRSVEEPYDASEQSREAAQFYFENHSGKTKAEMPAWFELDYHLPMKTYRIEGSNSATSSYRNIYYLDERRNVLYVDACGI